MGLFGKSKKEREKEYMSKLDVPSCLKENFELIIDDAFTIMGVGTVATGNILIGMCREGENACIYKANGDILESRITTVDVHTKERKANGCGYKTEHVGLGLRGISKEQLEKGDKVIVKMPICMECNYKFKFAELTQKSSKELFFLFIIVSLWYNRDIKIEVCKEQKL